jgi:hypothetical protein
MAKIVIFLTLALLAVSIMGAAQFTQSFLPRAFAINGDVLGITPLWKNTVKIITSRFTTAVQNGHYIQGSNLNLVRGSASTVQYTMTSNEIKFNSPPSFSGVFDFSWETYRQGTFRDTLIDDGRGVAEFSMKEYSYTVKFTQNAKNNFEATITDFACVFKLDIDPIYSGTPKQEITKTLFPLLKIPIEKDLNVTYCDRLKTSIQSTLNTLLTNAQTDQKISWSYDKRSQTKTLSLTPMNTDPFKEGTFIITANGALNQENHQSDQNIMKLERSLVEISDSGLGVQADDV